jgi:hypothetical protein
LKTPWQDFSPRPARTGEVLFGGVRIMFVAASEAHLRIDGCTNEKRQCADGVVQIQRRAYPASGDAAR